MSEYSEKIFGARINGENVICNENGEVVFTINTYFSDLYCGDNDWVSINEDSKVNYVDLEGNIVLELPEKYISAEGFIKVN